MPGSLTGSQNGSAYRCFCTPERLKSVREKSAKAGRPMAYDRHCLSLTEDEIDRHLKAKMPFTIRLNVSKSELPYIPHRLFI
jgi:glutamyl-tRNA synthetase